MFSLPGWDAGFLVPHPHGVYAAFVAGDEPKRQIYRLVVIYLLESRFPGLPEWFRQGVAEIYSTLVFETLERALQLRPEHMASWERLSFLYASLAAPSERAVEVGEHALELQPGRTDLVFNLLLMRAKLGEAEAVRELLDRLAALGGADAQVVSGREMLLQLQLRSTRELMRADRLDDAIGVLAEVQARTTSDQLRATATEWISRVQAIRDYNAFVSAYNQAVDAYNNDQLDLALERLTALNTIARSGEQARAIERLRSEVEYWRD